MIPIRNVYYMLAYAFRSLRSGGFERLSSEDFDNSLELCAAILCHAVELRLKQGVKRDYRTRREAMSALRGKVDMTATVASQAPLRRQLVCEYDAYSVDCPENRIIKATMSLLVRCSSVDARYRKRLRSLSMYFAEVADLDVRHINWRMVSGRADSTSRMIMFVCRLAIDGALQASSEGGQRLRSVLDDQAMHRLYEKFILEYYRAEHPNLSARAEQIPWCVDGEVPPALPVMQTDVTLWAGERVLIIDAKYYTHSMQRNYGAWTYHSGNLYQMFSYVKNAQAAQPAGAPPVAGMLLYAKTDEEVVPDEEFSLSSNTIAVRTLDLAQPFEGIRAQLDAIVSEFFPCERGEFESLTRFLPELAQLGDCGTWVFDHEHAGTIDDPIAMPYVEYPRLVTDLGDAIYAFVGDRPEYGLARYSDILEEHGLAWETESMQGADVSVFDGCAVLALLVGAVRAEHFCDGALRTFLQSGCIERWLQRLKELDRI